MDIEERERLVSEREVRVREQLDRVELQLRTVQELKVSALGLLAVARRLRNLSVLMVGCGVVLIALGIYRL